MNRLLSLGVVSLALGGIFFATPATSNAQAPVGFGIRIGDFRFNYTQGYPYAPYGTPGVVVPAPVTTFVPAPVVVPARTVVVPAPYATGYYGTRSFYPGYPGRHPHRHRHCD